MSIPKFLFYSGIIATLSQCTTTEPAPDKKPNGLTAAEIQKTIRPNLGQPRKCYEALLKSEPSAKGKLIVAINVSDGTGTVRDLK